MEPDTPGAVDNSGFTRGAGEMSKYFRREVFSDPEDACRVRRAGSRRLRTPGRGAPGASRHAGTRCRAVPRGFSDVEKRRGDAPATLVGTENIGRDARSGSGTVSKVAGDAPGAFADVRKRRRGRPARSGTHQTRVDLLPAGPPSPVATAPGNRGRWPYRQRTPAVSAGQLSGGSRPGGTWLDHR